MEFRLITEEHNCPYRLSVRQGAVSENHFHRHLELVLVLRGGITYLAGKTACTLGPRDFIFANPYEIHAVNQVAEDTNLIVLEIETQSFQPLFSSDPLPFFRWDETYNNRSLDFYREVTEAIRRIITEAINQEPAWLAKIHQDITGILIAIYRQCDRTSGASAHAPAAVYQTQRAAEIMEYLNAHYMEPLSLQSLSEVVHLSAPYVSKLFKETFGVGFLEYLNRLRIQKSLPSLENTSDYIVDIAVSVGFNSTKTYGRVFQQIMGVTPSEYRSQTTSAQTCTQQKQNGQEPMAHLLNFLSEGGLSPQGLPEESVYDTVSIRQDFTNNPGRTQPCRWNRTLSVGMAALLLQRRVQQEVLDAARDMGFQYVRFSGVLSDNLQIYQEQMDGTPVYFWVLLDEVLDFLQSHHLKPFLCLGFMPEKLATRKVPSPYNWNANTSKPRSLRQWSAYLRAFLQHCVNRYSYDEVCTWKFEFWNAPELKGLFWHDSDEDFQQFFLASYEVFREVLPKGLLGSPAFVKFNNYAQTRQFLEFCLAHRVHFDFLCLHMFQITDPHQNKDAHFSKILSLGPDQDIRETHYLNQAVAQFSRILSDLHIETPIYITEWNISPYHHDLSRDTCFMSTYIADTINHLPRAVEEIAFWALTDYTGEHIPHQDLFTGELGLKTHNGLPKPSYLAFILLHRMQDRLVASGDGYFLTSSGDSYQILLYNHAFYSQDFLDGTSHKLTELDRYQIYEPVSERHVQLHLTLPAGTYRIERHFLNREYGSVYDHWLRMGAPRQIDPSTYNYLHNKAYPDIQIRQQTVEEHLLLSEVVPVHGVELILLTRIQ